MKHRLYPLHHYSEAGDLSPPKIFIYMLLFLSRTWWLLIISIASRDNGEKLLQLFYPDKLHFYFGLANGIFPLIIFIVYGRRHAQDKWALKCWPLCFPILLFSILGDMSLQIYYIYTENFKYSITASIQLVTITWIAIYVMKSKHLKDCFKRLL